MWGRYNPQMQACFPFARPYLPTVHFIKQEMLNPSSTEVGMQNHTHSHCREPGHTYKAHLRLPLGKQLHFYRDAGKRQYKVSRGYLLSTVYEETD